MGDTQAAAVRAFAGGIGVFTHPKVLEHRASYGHVETPERCSLSLDAIRSSPVGGRISYHLGRRASIEEMMLVHDRGYLNMLAATDEDRQLDGDTYVCPHSFEAAAHAVGCVLSAVDSLVFGEFAGAFCVVRPPGHHARRDRAGGFCLLNNVAIGARYAQQLDVGRVMVVDFDAHHGDGTQSIFEQDSTVFYFSAHLDPLYPGSGGVGEVGSGKGEGFTCNVPLPLGSGDEIFLNVYGGTLPELVRKFTPQLVIVSAGYDVHRDDPLIDSAVTDDGVRRIVRSILQASRSVGCATLFVLEGGYDVPVLQRCTILTLEEMLHAAAE